MLFSIKFSEMQIYLLFYVHVCTQSNKKSYKIVHGVTCTHKTDTDGHNRCMYDGQWPGEIPKIQLHITMVHRDTDVLRRSWMGPHGCKWIYWGGGEETHKKETIRFMNGRRCANTYVWGTTGKNRGRKRGDQVRSKRSSSKRARSKQGWGAS